jgi:branched-chain amino acid transport system ATP-binding protein
MKALDIIQAEHRGLWRLTTAMDALARELERPAERAASAAVIASMLDYVDSYIDTVHHPKEDDHLFAALQRHPHDVAEVIDRLQREHREGPVLRDAVRALARQAAATPGADPAPLMRGVADFTAHLRNHIRTEEMHVLPAARQRLTADEWAAIDAAFLDNDDPLFGQRTRAEFDALRARIVALTPAPLGLGTSEVSEVSEAGEAGQPPPTQAPPPSAVAASADIVLRLADITSHYGRIQALHGINLEVRRGQLVALVGANGAGKTTLLRTISGVQPASGGAIQLEGADITRMAPAQRVRRGVCQVPEGRQVFGPMSIEDNLRLGAYTRRDSAVAEDMARMYALFPVLKEKRLLPAGTLSGGQQQMLAMARALMGRPRLLLLDEPSMGLAPLLVDEIFRVVRRLKSEGITIFLVEQNAHAALSIADTGYVIETGRTVLSGSGPELLRNERVRAAYLGM